MVVIQIGIVQEQKGEQMRLIKADDSLKRINAMFPRRTESDYQKGIAVGMALAKVAINEQPTVDAVEVVRCKDCKFYLRAYDCPFGILAIGAPDRMGYCFKAERRTDDSI